MEQRSVSEIIKQYQPLLRKFEKDDELVLSDAEEEPGTKAGENYMSVVTRTVVIGKRGDGTPYKKSFMRKTLMDTTLAKLFRNDELFVIEAYFYEKLLPHLGPVGPECVIAQPKEIIMEDLRARDFGICERRKMLDLEHCLAVIQTLASMHAASLRLKLNRPKEFEDLASPLCEKIFPNNPDCPIKKFYESGIEYALRSMESIENRTPEVERATEFIRSFDNRVADVMLDLLTPPLYDRRYWVITHGDTWNNNIMFLHDSQGKIVRVKFVDFQVARHASPAFDFTYFLYSSVRSEVLEEHIDEILSTYERFFIHDLRRLDAPERDLEAFSRPGWFKDEVSRYGLFGFFGALMVLHAIFAEEDQAIEIKLDENGGANPSKQDFILQLEPEKTKRLLSIINHYIRNFQNSK